MSPTAFLAFGLLVLIALSATFSGSETALFSLNRLQLRRFERSGSRRERLVAAVVSRPERLLAGILLGNTVVNVASSSVSLALLRRLEGYLFGLDPVSTSVVVATAVLLVAGEILPKGLAVHWPERVAPTLITVLSPLLKILTPVAELLARLARRLLRAVGAVEEKGQSMERGELQILFEDIQEGKEFTADEGLIASNLFEFFETRAYEVMTPRVDMVGVNVDLGPEAFHEAVIAARHSRVPVYRDNWDQVIGFLNAKEYLLEPDLQLDDLLRPVRFVPERARLSRVLADMQSQRLNLVIVVNEYGGTAGIITQEDIAEEVVGEIFNEQEIEEAAELEQTDAGVWKVAGLLSLHDMAEAMAITLPTGPAETVAGRVAYLLGRPPRRGDRVEDGQLAYRVLQVRRHRAQRVEVSLIESGGDS